jgi:haloalkane dehalogenase
MIDTSAVTAMNVSQKVSFEEHYVPQGQGNLYAKDYPGATPAFVLMHGLPDNSRIYDDLIPYLVAAGRRVVAFDFLGFGKSDKPAGAAYGFEQQLQDLKSVIDFLGIETFVPVVHDSSGPLGVNFTIDNPDRVASLVVLNSPYGEVPTLRWPELVEIFATKSLHALALAIAQSPEHFGWMLSWQRQQFRAHLPQQLQAHFEEFIGVVIEENFVREPSAGMAFVQMTAQLNDQIARDTKRYPELQALKTSVKIIWGRHDPYLNRGMAEELESHLGHATLYMLEAGHWLQSDAPDQVAALMLGSD